MLKKFLECNERTQRGQGLKILTPDQRPIVDYHSRLPITLAQLKAGNNSEIRQLLYSLYGSNKLTKIIYNHLINTI